MCKIREYFVHLNLIFQSTRRGELNKASDKSSRKYWISSKVHLTILVLWSRRSRNSHFNDSTHYYTKNFMKVSMLIRKHKIAEEDHRRRHHHQVLCLLRNRSGCYYDYGKRSPPSFTNYKFLDSFLWTKMMMKGFHFWQLISLRAKEEVKWFVIRTWHMVYYCLAVLVVNAGTMMMRMMCSNK